MNCGPSVVFERRAVLNFTHAAVFGVLNRPFHPVVRAKLLRLHPTNVHPTNDQATND